jgi:hypothetical protein
MGEQVKFTVTAEAVAFLRWYARNILFEDSAHDAARHLMMRQLERIRRAHRKEDPTPEDLATTEPNPKV